MYRRSLYEGNQADSSEQLPMSEMITIGKISRHHNREGELKVLILSDFPDRFLDLDRVFLEKGEDIKRVHVEEVWFQKDFAVIKFVEVKSLQDAERLKDYYIKVPASEAVELPEGHYFLHDIIGLDVFSEEGEMLGKVEDIITTGSHDIYVVDQGKKEIMIPAVKEVVKEIDLLNKKMIVHLLEGLRDL